MSEGVATTPDTCLKIYLKNIKASLNKKLNRSLRSGILKQ
jgi:hypothetical protein